MAAPVPKQRDFTAYLWESAWILPSIGMPITMFVALLLTAYLGGIHLPSHAAHLAASQVETTAPFDRPGLRQTAPGQYEAAIVARVWNWNPKELSVKRGSTVTFLIASKDVTHGLLIPGTTVNVMVLPGQISRVTYRFDHPGEYLLLCHEYCGTGHHLMAGRLIVED